MRLKEIELQFENCEYVTINGKYVGEFFVDGIKKSFSRLGCNSIDEIDECAKFMIEFSDDANKIANAVGSSDWYSHYDNVFGRIEQYADITGFRFVLVDYDGVEHEYSYIPIWEDADHNGEENLYQKSYISKNGFMYIVIGKDINIKDLPMYEYIDDKEYAKSLKEDLEEFRWDKYNDQRD